MEAATERRRFKPAARTGPSYAPALMVYLITCPSHKWFLSVAFFAFTALLMLALKSSEMLGGLDVRPLIMKQASEEVAAFLTWEEAIRGVNATILPLHQALQEEMIVRSARALLLDSKGRILMRRREAHDDPCFDSFELGVSAHCGETEDSTQCALKALHKGISAMEVYDFSAQREAERKYVYALADGHRRGEYTTLVCVYLPAFFPWKRVETSSWRFDKPAAVEMKLQEHDLLWCSEEFRALMEDAFSLAMKCRRNL